MSWNLLLFISFNSFNCWHLWTLIQPNLERSWHLQCQQKIFRCIFKVKCFNDFFFSYLKGTYDATFHSFSICFLTFVNGNTRLPTPKTCKCVYRGLVYSYFLHPAKSLDFGQSRPTTTLWLVTVCPIIAELYYFNLCCDWITTQHFRRTSKNIKINIFFIKAFSKWHFHKYSHMCTAYPKAQTVQAQLVEQLGLV